MKRILKKSCSFLFALLLVIIILPNRVWAVDDKSISSSKPSEVYNDFSYEYVIDAYDVKIKINENNTYDITEKISAYFFEPKHGIIRTIPLSNNVERLSTVENSNRARITNVRVNEKSTKSFADDYLTLQIGNANKTITGLKNYEISYTYNIGNDPLSDIDEFYYNIIGDEWDVPIGNVTFEIAFPKDFDESKLGFSYGSYGTINTQNVVYEVNDLVVTGKYNGILLPGYALTARVELEDGYFVGAGFHLGIFDYLSIIISIALAGFTVYLWHKHGRDSDIVETVEFYPPEGLNSLDVGYIYHNSANTSAVLSLLIYLADKGYIKIDDSGIDEDHPVMTAEYSKVVKEELNKLDQKIKEESIFDAAYQTRNLKDIKKFWEMLDKPVGYEFNKKELKKIKNNESLQIRFTKLKEYDGDNKNEKTFFDNLFVSREVGESIVLDELKYNFYQTINIIESNEKTDMKYKIYNKKSSSKRTLAFIFMVVIFFITLARQAIFYLPDSFPSMLYMTTLLLIFMFIISASNNLSTKFSKFWYYLLLGILVIRWGSFGSDLAYQYIGGQYFIVSVVGIISMLIIGIFAGIMPQRTEYGSRILGRVRGFANFLETAEKDRLEALVAENPTYFYDILPYTYALGISNKWVKKFEGIAIEPPDWYYSNDPFSYYRFDRFMNDTMSSVQTVMAVAPSSDNSSHDFTSFSGSSGGFSGGGFSGGGSGGGGGSSW